LKNDEAPQETMVINEYGIQEHHYFNMQGTKHFNCVHASPRFDI
jgi:hypothetical protein